MELELLEVDILLLTNKNVDSMPVTQESLLALVVLNELECEFWRHFLDVDQHRLLQACTFLIHLAPDFVFCREVWLQSKLYWLSTEFDEQLVQDENLAIEEACFVKVNILLYFDGLISRQFVSCALEIELRLIELGLHILEFHTFSFELREDFDAQFDPLVDLH